MTQPKNVIFETGAPKIINEVTVDGVTYSAPDEWSVILDLREDEDQDVVRRVTLFAHRNVDTNVPDPPAAATSAFVVVIDDSITTGEDAILEGLVAGCALPVGGVPVKIMDDYPIRGAVRMLVGAGPQSAEPIDNVVVFGYYTVAGSEGTRAMCDLRPFQIGNAVPDIAIQTASMSSTTPLNLHETTSDQIDEITMLGVFSSGPTIISFYEASATEDPLLSRYLYFEFRSAVYYALESIPVRNTGIITIAAKVDLDSVGVTGFFTRY